MIQKTDIATLYQPTFMRNQPLVYVIVVTYNGVQWIRECINSVRGSIYPCVIVVVDNASTDGTQQILSDEYKNIIYLPQEKNLGFGSANNIGISVAINMGADFCFLLNQDAFMLPDTISTLVAFMQCHPTYELATPLHCNPDTSRLDPKTQRTYLQHYQIDLISDACLGRLKDYYQIRGINAAAWLVSTRAWLKVGGFDPLFFMYGEDDDLINRFDYHELTFALIPNAYVIHVRGKNPTANLTWVQSIKRLAIRKRASFLVSVKFPSNDKLRTRLLVLFCDGLLRPTVDFLIERNFSELFAHYLATISIIIDIKKIIKHAKLCRETGPHFLNNNISSR